MAVSCSPKATIMLTNGLQVARSGEMVELESKAISSRIGDQFILTDNAGKEVPYQITSDSTLIFQADVAPMSTARYFAKKGTPAAVTPKVYGRKYPEHKDNMNWENDLAAYVAYGPALQQRGERGFGYDVWTKSVDTLVIEERNRLRDLGKSLHRDHGNGMDAYIVANTLGAGTAALLNDDGSILFPWAWREYEILDNGPLRFKVRLTYNPFSSGKDNGIVEERTITLDAGSDLNRTEVRFAGLNSDKKIASGIVVHQQNPYGDMADSNYNIIAYADSTDNARNGNGVIYIGVIVPGKDVDITYRPVDEPARDALGHILAVTEIRPGESLDYFWGSAWSKNPTGPQTPKQWLSRLRNNARRINNPIKIEVK